jgi:tetratricopeptide (TPR) repeat protein
MRILFLLAGLCILSGCMTDYHQAAIAKCNGTRSGVSPDVVIQNCTAAIGFADGLDSKNTAGALTNRGGAYMLKGDYVAAVLDLTAALRIEPDLQQAYADRGASYANLGNTAAALSDLNRSLLMRPNDATALNMRCWTRARANIELGDALIDCDSGLALAPNATLLLDSRGLVEYRMGKLKDAQADYDAVLRARPQMPSSLYVRGLIRRQLGDAAGGQTDIDAAKALVPGIVDFYARLGIPQTAQPAPEPAKKKKPALKRG